MSRTRTLSLALLAIRLSRSLRSLSSRDSASSVLLGSHSTTGVSQGAKSDLGIGVGKREGDGAKVWWKNVHKPLQAKMGQAN